MRSSRKRIPLELNTRRDRLPSSNVPTPAIAQGLRKLAWGGAWLELASRRSGKREKLEELLDLVAVPYDHHRFRPAATAFATELASRFGDQPSPAFVNGVLDAIARATRSDAARGPAGDAVGEPGSEGLG